MNAEIRTPKAILFDVDGTLMSGDSNKYIPSQKVIDAVNKVSSEFPTGLMTGKHVKECGGLEHALGLSGCSGYLDGALVRDIKKDKMIAEQTIDRSATKVIAEKLVEEGVMFWVHDDGSDHIFDEQHDYGLLMYPRKTDLKTYKPYKPLFIVVKDITPDILSEIKNVTDDTESMTILHVDGLSKVSIRSKMRDKGRAVEVIAEHLNIEPHDILGFGDGMNDIGFSEACTFVAMENAVPEVKERAVFQAPHVDKDGVAVVLEKFILNKYDKSDSKKVIVPLLP